MPARIRQIRSGRPRLAVAAALVIGASLTLAAPASAGSLKRVNFRADAPTELKTFFEGGGLVLKGSCLGTGDLLVLMRSKHDNAMVHFNGQSAGDDADYAERDDFDAGAANQIDLFGSGNAGGLGDGATREAPDNNSGQIVYARPGGKVVTVDWASEEGSDTLGGTKDCAFVGTARVLGKGDSSRVNFRMGIGAAKPFKLGGLTLTASCSDNNGLLVGGGSLAGEGGFLVANEQTGDDEDGVEFHAGGGAPGNDFNKSLTIGLGGFGALDNSAGQLIYSRPGGGINVTIDWMGEESAGVLGGKRCVFVGTARKRESGDPKRLNFRSPSGQFGSAFLGGGLQLGGTCSPSDVLGGFADTFHDDAMLHANQQGGGNVSNYADDNNLDAADPLFNFLAALDDTSSDQRSDGQLIYARPGGVNVTADYAAAENSPNLYGNDITCALVGTAEVAKP